MPQIDLTNPEPAVTSYRPVMLELRHDTDHDSFHVHLLLRTNTGETVAENWEGAEAQTMIEQINVGVRDGTGSTLWQQILQRLLDDGRLEGTIS